MRTTTSPMDFQTRKDHALAILARHGLKPNHLTPPLFRILWKLGIQVRPPHFASFATLTALFGTLYGVLWGTCMWVAFWSGDDRSVLRAALTTAGTGLCYGLFMAFVYRRHRRKYKLPSWESLGDVPQEHASPISALPR